jgi:hypothetical protein
MADNFGTGQNRVLTVKDRSIDNVVFQYKRPPLTSEWNLINQVSNEKIQDVVKVCIPSGWLNINDILQDATESEACSGDVLCSEDYDSNSFKLVSIDNNIAIVNGWPILVQGSESVDDNNIIILDEPTGQSYDFVFLEVWRKLVGSDDNIYPYGNVTKNPFSDNEIEWDVIGTETTKRVQLQYCIRSVKISMAIVDVTKEIFDLTDIYPIGGRTTGEAVLQKYLKYGSEDPGLYVAGDGSSSSQEYLNTVDGYVYAIPMFIVHRRALSSNTFLSTTINNTKVDKEMLITGYRSDRPDSKIADIIYKEDIVDLRHLVSSSNNLKSITDISISKLMAGDLSTTLKKGFGEDGAITSASSGGNTLLKVERLNSVGGDNIPDVGVGSDITGGTFKRRAFSNAELIHNHNIVEITDWESETGAFFITSKVVFPPGEIISVDGFYSPDQSSLLTEIYSDGVTITIGGGTNLVAGNRLFMEYTFKYYSSSKGFKDVPKEFLEVNKNDSVIIATRDNDIPLRYNNSGELLNFGASAGESGYPGDITTQDCIRYRGGNYTELSNFGHELVLYRTTNASGIVNIELSNNKYNEYYILGVKSISVLGDLKNFTAERVITTSPYAITNYIITLSSYPNTDVIITLYTGSKFVQDVGDSYSIADSVKFFELSKQGRGITDTYEVIEVIGVEGASGIYTIDTGDKPIIKIVTKAITTGGYTEGTPFAYKFDASGIEVSIIDITVNNIYPILDSTSYTADYFPTKMNIEATSGLTKIRVPVLVHSYVTANESPYNYYYKTIPYQGILNMTSDFIYGKISQEEGAVITTLGSGGITDYYYNTGTASFAQGSRIISGIGTLWNSYVQAGDYIRISGGLYYYRILGVSSDISIILAETYKGITVLDNSYEIIRLDISKEIVSNIVDRLPSLSIVSSDNITDYTCYSDDILSDYGTLLFTGSISKLQDPLNAWTNDFILGNSTVAKRGRSDFRLTLGDNTLFKVGSGRSYIKYRDTEELVSGRNKKVYQFYLFIRSGRNYQDNDSDLMGKVYLLVIAGESISQTKNILNPFSDKDVVDIYELVGRPIIKV